MTYLTVPISAGDFDQAVRQIKTAKKAGAEMLELRTDYLENLDSSVASKLVAEIKSDRKHVLPVIVTCRDKKQGGAIGYPDNLRVEVLISAIKAGAEFIDFEYENFITTSHQEKIRVALSQSSRTRLILSVHNFKGRFDDIAKTYRRVVSLYPAAIPKLVYTANHINDCFNALDLLRRTSDERIIFCMGKAGLMTRVIAKKLGSFVTFASLDEDSATAPGQLTIEEFKKLYRFDSIDAETEFYGILGSPVEHSLSPLVHNTCFTNKGMNKVYLPMLVEGGKEDFDRFMSNILGRSWLGFRGFSVTIPHKQNALEFVRERKGFIEPLADVIHAANTVLLTPGGRLSAYNTDYKGALDAIRSSRLTNLKNVKVAVIGAGGVARAVVAGLSGAGARITIYNRTVKKAERLADQFNCEFAPLSDLKDVDAKLVVNCTNIGMYPDIDATPISADYLKKGMTVFDSVYNPRQTLLLKQAKQAGAKTVEGILMFVNQAMAQFKLFTGSDADTKIMYKVVDARLSKC